MKYRNATRLTFAISVLLLMAVGVLGLLQCGAGGAQAQTVTTAEASDETTGLRLATYNVEHFMRLFDQVAMPERSRDRTELFRDEEDLYEIARVILSPQMRPDVLTIQESCSQEMLEWFNREYLDGYFAFVHVFPSNVEGQWVAILAVEWLEPVDIRSYADEVDPVDDPAIRGYKYRAGFGETNRLFSRGPGFVQFETAAGRRFWVGTTHVKSKSGNNEAVTRWRIRELTRTREICRELLAEGDTDLLAVMGDFNDDYGLDRYEQAIGVDALAVMTDEGPLESLTLAITRAQPQLATYHCQIKPPTYRSFIDHVFASEAMVERAVQTYVVDTPIAAVASDHYPVVTVIDLGR